MYHIVFFFLLFYFLFFAAIEAIDITRILSQKGGEPVYPLPKVKNLAVHPKLNLAALVFTVSNHYHIKVI